MSEFGPHLIRLDREGSGWVAVCLCGRYRSKARSTSGQAQSAGREHATKLNPPGAEWNLEKMRR